MLKSGEIVLYRGRGSELYPADEDSENRLRKLKECTWYTFTIKLRRNYLFHRKYFGMLNMCFDNQDEFIEKEWFRKYILIKIGWCDVYIAGDGTLLTEVKSLAFTKCTQSEFEELYNKTLDYILLRFGYTEEFTEELRIRFS